MSWGYSVLLKYCGLDLKGSKPETQVACWTVPLVPFRAPGTSGGHEDKLIRTLGSCQVLEKSVMFVKIPILHFLPCSVLS